MNCKQGDLAIIVQSACGYEGKIVTCARFLGEELWISFEGKIRSFPTWEIDKELLGINGRWDKKICDYQLRRIPPLSEPESKEIKEEIPA